MMTYDDRHIADSTTRLELASVLVESAYHSMKEFAEFKAEAGLCKAALEIVREAYHAVAKIEFNRTVEPRKANPDSAPLQENKPLEKSKWISDSIESVEMPKVTKCPLGYGEPATCGHCLASGACNATVLTSSPPKYNMCPFRGSGYIYCSEA